MASRCKTVLGDLYLVSFLQSTATTVAARLGRQSLIIRHLRPVYEWLLELSTVGRGIPWSINGVTNRIDPRHRHRMGHNYDASAAAFLCQAVKPGDLCINVGANVGIYVLQFAYWSRPSGQIIAFEPNPSALPVLQRHIELNQLTKRVRTVPVAVADRRGESTFYAAGADGMSRLGSPNSLIADRVACVTVPVVTLDEYCEQESLKPDWLFLDIEGFELRALLGSHRIIRQRGADLKIIVEMHPDAWDIAGNNRQQFEEFLATLGLGVLPLSGQTDPWKDHGLVYISPSRGRN
jgi:FkbM family methyltransferase